MTWTTGQTTFLHLKVKYVLWNDFILNRKLATILFENSSMYYKSNNTSNKSICCCCSCGKNANLSFFLSVLNTILILCTIVTFTFFIIIVIWFISKHLWLYVLLNNCRISYFIFYHINYFAFIEMFRDFLKSIQLLWIVSRSNHPDNSFLIKKNIWIFDCLKFFCRNRRAVS